MAESPAILFQVGASGYTVGCTAAGVPRIYREYVEHADLADELGMDAAGGDDDETCFVAVARGDGRGWPFLVVAQRYSPAGHGFNPGVLIIPETQRMFVGAGARLLLYDLEAPARLWEDATDVGFWGWARHGDVVVMSAELELAAWDLHGRKLWSAYVEPPWDYALRGDVVVLDVMGNVTEFPLRDGPPPRADNA